MNKTEICVLAAGLLIFNACGVSPNIYVLSVASQPSSVYASKNRSIGVEKITIPGYLYKREIAYAKSPSQIAFLSGSEWGEDLDEGLTHRLISFLQKKFREPRVYEYPWNTETKPKQKVKVQITRFIAYGDRVYLDANWEIKNVSGRQQSKLFTTSVPTTAGNPAAIVASMDTAFRELEESIARGLN